jgi:hypothetical protein
MPAPHAWPAAPAAAMGVACPTWAHTRQQQAATGVRPGHVVAAAAPGCGGSSRAWEQPPCRGCPSAPVPACLGGAEQPDAAPGHPQQHHPGQLVHGSGPGLIWQAFCSPVMAAGGCWRVWGHQAPAGSVLGWHAWQLASQLRDAECSVCVAVFFACRAQSAVLCISPWPEAAQVLGLLGWECIDSFTQLGLLLVVCMHTPL